MKNILKNRRKIVASVFACVSVFLFLAFSFFLLQGLIDKYFLSDFMFSAIVLLSALLTALLYLFFLRKHKTLLELIAIPGMLVFIVGVVAIFFPRQYNQRYDACRENADNTYKQALKERGYPEDTIADNLKEEDRKFWIKYLDELPKCDKYK